MLAEAALPRRTGIAIALGLGALPVAGWALPTWLMDRSMADTAAMGGQLSGGGMAAIDVATWIAMMAAMMLPATAPVLGAVARIARSRREQGAIAQAPWVFGVGYLLVWVVFGAVAAGIDLGGRAAIGDIPSLATLAPRGAG